MDLNFLKNPILLTIIAVALTYLYLYWDMRNKQERNPNTYIEPPGFMIPAGIGLVTFLITYKLFGLSWFKTNDVSKTVESVNTKPVQNAGNINNNNLSEKLTEGFDSNTYHMVRKNTIRLPKTDVFIDLAKF